MKILKRNKLLTATAIIKVPTTTEAAIAAVLFLVWAFGVDDGTVVGCDEG
jgi:hypothetical protein